MSFEEFRATYPARNPRANVIRNSDELIPMGVEDGLLYFDEMSGAGATTSGIPRVADDRGRIYLWVVSSDNVPYVLEDAPFGMGLETKCIKHTNLTGGQPAHCGGELWFISSDKILVGGSSGHYGSNSAEELYDAALSFKQAGYNVASLGFDEDSGFCAKILVGDPEWL